MKFLLVVILILAAFLIMTRLGNAAQCNIYKNCMDCKKAPKELDCEWCKTSTQEPSCSVKTASCKAVPCTSESAYLSVSVAAALAISAGII